jgi:hypothetical protein
VNSRVSINICGRYRRVASAFILALSAVCIVGGVCIPQTATAQSTSYVEAKQKAKVAYKAGQYQAAAKHFRQAFDFSPRGALLYNIGLCYEKAESFEEAIRFYQRFIDAVPSSSRRSALQEKIGSLKKKLDTRYRTVQVSSNPIGAHIFVNDRASGSMGKTPISFQLLPGEHKIIADLKNHEPEYREIRLGDESKVRVQFEMSLSSEYTDVKFMVSEIGADVLVDRRSIGKSPIVGVKRLREGAHQVLAMKPGYKNWSRTIQVKGPKRNKVDIELAPEGQVSIEVDDEEAPSQMWPWVTMGVGGAALVGGAITGMMANSLHTKLQEKKDRRELIASADVDTGNSLVGTTNILLGVGALAVAGGLTWWLLDSTGVERSESMSTVFVPTPEGGVISFGGQF